MIELYVSGQSLRLATPVVAADSLGCLEARVHFTDASWDGLSKWLHFKRGDTVYDLKPDPCGRVRKEDGLNLTAGEWTVYLTGSDLERRATTVPVMLTVKESGLVDAPLHALPMSVAEQLANDAAAALKTARELKAMADEGGFNGRDGVSFVIEGFFESAEALAAGVPEPEATVFGSDAASLSADLKVMDGKRASMQASYAALERYAADRSAIDDGKKGAELVASLEADYKAFAKAREHFIVTVNAKAEDAQGVLLRAHPLKAQVLLARRIFEGFRKVADAVGIGEPDAKIMAGILEGIAADIEMAEQLPFPLAGEVEMAYRHYLKGSRAVLDAFRQGVSAFYSQDVRQGINEAWTMCRTQYNAFVDASSAVVVKRP